MNWRTTAKSAAPVAVLLAAALSTPATATAAVNTATTSIAVDPGTSIEMHVTANCVTATGNCDWNTSVNLMTPDGPAPLPGDTWARQTITLRTKGRDVWQENSYSAPSGTPREIKGANHDNVLSKQYKGLSNMEISITYFGGGSFERFQTDGTSQPIDWNTGLAATSVPFFACSQIQVVYGGVNLTTPSACAQTTFS